MSMEVLHDTTGKKEAVVYYMNAPVPYAIEENFGGCFFEDDDDLALVLQEQEIVHRLIEGNDGSGSSRARSDPSPSYGHQRTLDGRKLTGSANYASQLAVDEALARELQKIEDQISETSIDGNIIKEGKKPASSSTSNNGNTSASRCPQVATEDGVDPDNMTYEELQQLGETIGTESKGLPDDMIMLLKSSTYKISIFSRKEKHDEYVLKPIRSLNSFLFVLNMLYIFACNCGGSDAQVTHKYFTPKSCITCRSIEQYFCDLMFHHKSFCQQLCS